MKCINLRRTVSNALIVCATLVLFALVSVSMFGQSTGQDPSLPNWSVGSRVSLPMDWSSKHVVLTKAYTPAQGQQVKNDPRLYNSWALQGHINKYVDHSADAYSSSAKAASATSGSNVTTAAALTAAIKAPRKAPNPAQRDWSFSLGRGGVAQNMSPAKWNFDINSALTASNCAGANTAADFVVYGLNVVGSSTQPNLVALQNLYSGTAPTGLCGTVPTVKYAYNVSTVTNGMVTTSPVLSIDGTMIAFIESSPTVSVFHVLKWKDVNGTMAAPIAPTAAANITTCTAPCMVSITYDATHATTNSSPYFDYGGSNVAYVGSDNGQLFKFTSVFSGTPALATTGGWLAAGVTVAPATTVMTAPILDSTTGRLFVGGSDGKLYSVLSTAAATQSSIAVGSGNANGGGIVDPPIVDSFAGKVFAYAAANVTNVGGITLTQNTKAVVVQSDTATPFAASKTSVSEIGQGSLGSTANVDIHTGSFDDAYFSWPGTGANSGHLFMCGTASGAASPTLYQIPFGALSGVSITANGSGYTAPTVTFSGGGGTGATGTASGTVTAVTVGTRGSGYTSAPVVGFTGGGGTGATATATLTSGVASVAVAVAGTGYTSVPAVSFSGGGGSGAAATAVMGVNAIALTNSGGAGYTAIPTVSFTTGTATATAQVGVDTISVTSTPGTGTLTFAGANNSGETVTIGGVVYAFSTSSATSLSGNQVFRDSGATDAQNAASLEAAINKNQAQCAMTLQSQNGSGGAICFSTSVGSTAGVTATISGTVVTVSNASASAVNFAEAASDITKSAGTTIPAASGNGSAGCTNGSATALTFTGAGGTGAAGTANVTGNVVQSVTLTAAGSGYTAIPTFTVAGCTTQPTTRTVKVKVTGFAVTAAGTGSTDTTVTLSTSGSTTAATAASTLKVVSFTVTASGTGYASVPAVSVAAPPSGTTATGTATIANVVNTITITNNGTGYTTSPTVTITGGGGSGAAATSTLNITAVTITSPGSGYTSLPTVTFAGGGTGATGTATIDGSLMAAGIPTVSNPINTVAGTECSPLSEIMTSGILTIASLTRSSTTVTVTTQSPHGFSVGDSVAISGVTGTNCAVVNITATLLTTATATTFTYNGTGTGTLTCTTTTALASGPGNDLMFYGWGVRQDPNASPAVGAGTDNVESQDVGNGALTGATTTLAVPTGSADFQNGGTSAIAVDNIATQAQAASVYFTARGVVAGTSIPVTGGTRAGGTPNVATITTSSAHGLRVGDTVISNGTNPTGFSDASPFVITAVPSTTTFQYVIPSITTTGTLGTVGTWSIGTYTSVKVTQIGLQ